jgi:hypothetical protein
LNKELFDPPGIVRSVDALAELAGRINAEHQQSETALRAGLEHAKKAGELLLEAKEQCGHGKWLPWLKANVKFSERTARRYMTIASRWEELANRSRVSDLSYREALAVLSSPEPEPFAVQPREIEYLPSVLECDDARAEILPTGLKIDGNMTFEQWKEMGAYLTKFARNIKWNNLQIGIWLIECREACLDAGDDWPEWLAKNTGIPMGQAERFMAMVNSPDPEEPRP